MKGKLLRIGTIILGNVFVAFAVSTLVLENQLISGGVTGLGIVTNHYTGINISLIVGIINVLLFLLGLFFIGKKFALSTLISTFAFPVLLEFFNTNAIFHNYCQDTLLAVVLAGCLVVALFQELHLKQACHHSLEPGKDLPVPDLQSLQIRKPCMQSLTWRAM